MTPFLVCFLLLSAELPVQTPPLDESKASEDVVAPAKRFKPKQRSLVDTINLEVGINTTPYRSAFSTDDPTNQYGQASRRGPSVGVAVFHSFGEAKSSSVFLEGNYDNTNTVLHGPMSGTIGWTMHRIDTDLGYQYRFLAGHQLRPFVRVGLGSMTLISANASNHGGTAGLDCRFEKFAALGVEYPVSRHLGLLAQVEGRFYRNSDFSDIAWNPRNNFTIQPKLGLSLHF